MELLKNKWFIGFLVALILLFSAGIDVGNYFVNYALSPSSNSADRQIKEDYIINISDEDAGIIASNEKIEDEKGKSFELTTSKASIKSSDNLTFNGKYRTIPDSNLWAILVHGYKSDNTNMMDYGMEYYNRGYNVLLPNNRAHGDSEGKYIGMGWLDKDDIALWINWIVQQDSNAKIVIHGVSMGGATAMMLSGDNPSNVIGYVEDCGYTGVWEIFASELDKRFSLPTFPVLNLAQIVANVKAGYNFKKASAVEQVKKCQKPMLFIHGGKDDFVPIDMVYTVYEAAACQKDIFIVEPAGHAEAKNYNPAAYWDKVFDFINNTMLAGQ